MAERRSPAPHKLGELASTAICGNDIPTNLMFIGSPTGESMKYRLEEFGGVRLII